MQLQNQTVRHSLNFIATKIVRKPFVFTFVLPQATLAPNFFLVSFRDIISSNEEYKMKPGKYNRVLK